MSAAPDHRTRPRRRGEALETAILAAVLDELQTTGYAALTVDRIAGRARVSKASLYRRWPGKAALVVDAVRSTLPDAGALPDTGSLRTDLIEAFRQVAEGLSGPAGAALRGVLSEALRDPDTAAELVGLRQGNSVELVRALVTRASGRGELPSGAIPVRRLEVGPAMLRHEFLVRGSVSDEYVVELVDQVVLPLVQGETPPAG
jgi:AcrR family transcriptional regulator